nr:GpE family phage tail protein [Escherichia coli]
MADVAVIFHWPPPDQYLPF